MCSRRQIERYFRRNISFGNVPYVVKIQRKSKDLDPEIRFIAMIELKEQRQVGHKLWRDG